MLIYVNITEKIKQEFKKYNKQKILKNTVKYKERTIGAGAVWGEGGHGEQGPEVDVRGEEEEGPVRAGEDGAGCGEAEDARF